MKRRGHYGGKDDPHQLSIQWGTRSHASDPIPPIKPQPSDTPADQPTLIQHLPWDFLTTFPDPLEDSLEAGRFTNEDARPAIIKSFHAELGLQLARILAEQDEIADGRRLGVDPKTGIKPQTPADQDRLDRIFAEGPATLDRLWQSLVGVYEEAFGPDSTQAFLKAIRARHAGIPVVADAPATAGSPDENPQKADKRSSKTAWQDPPGGKPRRIISRLPVSKPLPHAVVAGHFGQDELGPIRPSADEVREITENHAALLIELLAQQRDAQRSRSDGDNVNVAAEIQKQVQKYAEDFGEHAAEQLLAFARRQVSLNATQATGKSR